jgi:large subunit ribosomal protein L23
MKDLSQVIKDIRLSEKATLLTDKYNQFVFKVHPKATKIEVRKAVEVILGKKVLAVNTSRVKGKVRRRRRPDEGVTAQWKKAVVTLAEGESIDLT